MQVACTKLFPIIFRTDYAFIETMQDVKGIIIRLFFYN